MELPSEANVFRKVGISKQEQVKKKSWGDLKGKWAPHDVRDAIVDFIRYWTDRTGISRRRLIVWTKLPPSKYYNSRDSLRKGWANTTPTIPRDHWLEDWEKKAIEEYSHTHPLDGYRRLTFMMIDEDIIAASEEQRLSGFE